MTVLQENNLGAPLELSVVLIARNEARNIARAIESVLRATTPWPQSEILLVDSASTDETVEIARRYPISIVRLPSSWFLSVAAGRHIGMHYTHGELVLHMDGDMEMDPLWVSRAMAYALEHPAAAAIGGYWRDVYTTAEHTVIEKDQMRDPLGQVREEPFVNGVMLCRRSAIQKAGGFQPYIRGEEDVDLCLALRNAGYKVVRLPYLASRHFCIPHNSVAGSLRRVRLNLWLGFGQVPRRLWGTPLFWSYLRLRITAVIFLLSGLALPVCLLLSLLTRNMGFAAGWMILALGLFVAYVIKKRSLRGALAGLFSHVLISYSAVRGFLTPPRSPAEYPTDAEIIQLRASDAAVYEPRSVETYPANTSLRTGRATVTPRTTHDNLS
jgi:glycosyltransferase involved in cell wall biosynthesis